MRPLHNLSPRRRLEMRSGLAAPALFTVGWYDAIFEHYRITDEAPIAALLPPELALDRHEGSAFLSVVSFRMVDMKLRGEIPLPLSSTYPQINVRVYVRSEDRAGVFFLRNFVSNRLAARAGRFLYGMPYVYQHVENSGPGPELSCVARLPEGLLHSVAGVRGARMTGHEDDTTSLLFFLVERYPLFSRHGDATYEAQMLHRPWELYELASQERTHAIPRSLGLADALMPLDAVQTSPGVNVLIWAGHLLGEMPALVPIEAPAGPTA